MTSELARVRFQETWGDQESGYLPDPYLTSDIPGLMVGLAADWFPNGATHTQDPDSPTTWTIDESAPPRRRVFFFVESMPTLGDIDVDFS